MMQRAEDKLNYLFQQYQSEVQEMTNRRINTLTIVQAIFVPLTFIAGIYGMNFVACRN
jgi:magnesium transporter